MKAVVYDQPGDESVLYVGEVASPRLGSGDLRLRVAAAGVNRADLLQRQGLYPPPPGASSIPRTPGFCMAFSTLTGCMVEQAARLKISRHIR